MRKKILITGATGWIGRHVLDELKSKDFEVHALTSRSTPPYDGFVHWHTVDLHDHAKVNKFVADLKASHLLHLAWYVEHGQFWTSPQNLIWVESSINLVRAFVESGGERVIAAGTCAEYAWNKQEYDETSALFEPKTFYGVCKRALHQVLEAYCKQAKVSFAWGYVFHIFGPGENSRRFVPQVINALFNARTQACSTGTQYRDFIYVKDLARAFVELTSSSVQGGINLATGHGITLKEIGLKIAEKMESQKELLLFDQLPCAKNDPEWLVAKTSRLKDDLHWTPRYTLDEALQETIDWWKKQ